MSFTNLRSPVSFMWFSSQKFFSLFRINTLDHFKKTVVPASFFPERWLTWLVYVPPIWYLLSPAKNCAHHTSKLRSRIMSTFAISVFQKMLEIDVNRWKTWHSLKLLVLPIPNCLGLASYKDVPVTWAWHVCIHGLVDLGIWTKRRWLERSLLAPTPFVVDHHSWGLVPGQESWDTSACPVLAFLYFPCKGGPFHHSFNKCVNVS